MNALVFGGRGALGEAICRWLRADGAAVIATTSQPTQAVENQAAQRWIQVDPQADQGLGALDDLPRLDAVVWAQGVNASDSVTGFDADVFAAVIEANVTFIARTLARLLELDRLATPARLCILSSIWQEQARTVKFSYTVSKAAVAGLVRSCAADLGPRQVLVNAVLPGVVDTPMTHANLASEQIDAICSASALARLATPEDIAAAVAFLVGPTNGAITGQSLIVDAGFSHIRNL
jgi:NAD(P)-dependent dehydrogenase (short-subunit alcohol dehydrogenase family)